MPATATLARCRGCGRDFAPADPRRRYHSPVCKRVHDQAQRRSWRGIVRAVRGDPGCVAEMASYRASGFSRLDMFIDRRRPGARDRTGSYAADGDPTRGHPAVAFGELGAEDAHGVADPGAWSVPDVFRDREAELITYLTTAAPEQAAWQLDSQLVRERDRLAAGHPAEYDPAHFYVHRLEAGRLVVVRGARRPNVARCAGFRRVVRPEQSCDHGRNGQVAVGCQSCQRRCRPEREPRAGHPTLAGGLRNLAAGQGAGGEMEAAA